jgi:hypothetical protein
VTGDASSPRPATDPVLPGRAAELTPDNMESLAGYSCPGGRAATVGPVVTSESYL